MFEESFYTESEGEESKKILEMEDFLGGPVVKNLPANAGDTGLTHGLGRIHMPWISWACGPQPLPLRTLDIGMATRDATTLRSQHTASRESPK